MPMPDTARRVKELVAAGKSHRAIAKELGIAVSTVSVLRHEPNVVDVDADTQRIEYRSDYIKTEDDAIRECRVDLNKWYVHSFECTAWTTPVKTKGGKDAPDTLNLVQNFRVALKLKRIQTKMRELAFEAVFKRMADHAPKYPAIVRPKTAAEKEMAVFCLFDVHFGKLAWQPETNDNYDLKIADKLYRNAVEDLAAKSRHRNIAKIVMPLGSDFFHVDNLRNQTTAGTPQDADGRYAKIIETGELAVIWAVEHLRQIAPVEMCWVPGNHDAQTSYHLARTVWAWFSKANDVTVDLGPTSRKYVRWGCNLLGFTHGNEEKHDSLPMLMANERPSDFAETTCREWLIGHQHQSKAYFTKGIETRAGTVVRVVQSLAGTDAWHHRKSFINLGRSAECFFYGEKTGMAGWVPFNVRNAS